MSRNKRIILGGLVLVAVFSAALLIYINVKTPKGTAVKPGAGEQQVTEEQQVAEASSAPADGTDIQATEEPADSGEKQPGENVISLVEYSGTAVNAACRANGIAVTEDGSLLVMDIGSKVIWQVRDGISSVFAGGETVADYYGEPMGGYNDDVSEKSFFSYPWAAAPFLDGWAVSDAGNNAVRLIANGKVQTINGTTEEKLKTGKYGVIFDYPTGLAADPDGNLYVSDTHNGAVRRISKEGIVSTFATGLREPTGLCWKDGVLYIAETDANRVLRCADGRLEVLAGCGETDYIDGTDREAAFAYPQGIAVGDDGTVYVADTGNSAIRTIRDGEVTTLLLRDRTALELEPVSPVGLLVWENELYICDSFTGKVLRIAL